MINKIINLTIYLLRYFSIIKTIYKISNKVNFGSYVSNKFFKKNLKNCKFYLEYGAGSSTFLAKKLNKNFLSIEADKSFYTFIKNKGVKNINFADIGPTKYYSIPILPTYLILNKIKIYANQIRNFFQKFNNLPDFILIDGRFRVFVTLSIIEFYLSKKKLVNLTLIIDDFKNRKNYHSLRKIFKIKLVGRFGVIKLNKRSKIKKHVIKKYLKSSVLNYI
jgi:hypothetical protein